MEKPPTRTKVLDRLVAQNFNFDGDIGSRLTPLERESDKDEKASRENLPQHSCWSGSENASRKRAETTPRAEHFTDHLLGRLKTEIDNVRRAQAAANKPNLRARIASEGQEANLERARAQGTSYCNTYAS